MELDDFVHRCEAAWHFFVTGDATPAKGLFSRDEDVTLANPWGPAATGWAEVSRTLDAAAARFRNGRVLEFDIRTHYASGDLAWFHEVERGQAMLGGRSELDEFALRVTSIYRRESGDWKIVLRHADPIVTPRPAGATISS